MKIKETHPFAKTTKRMVENFIKHLDVEKNTKVKQRKTKSKQYGIVSVQMATGYSHLFSFICSRNRQHNGAEKKRH